MQLARDNGITRKACTRPWANKARGRGGASNNGVQEMQL